MQGRKRDIDEKNRLLDRSHSDWGEMVPHSGFDLHFSDNGNNNPVYETAKETLMYRSVLWTLWERERVGRFGRMALKHVKYHV